MSDPIIDAMLASQNQTAPQTGAPDDDPIIQEMRQAQQATTSRAALAVADASTSGVNADRAAQNQILAKRYKVAPSVVDQFPEDFRQRALTENAAATLNKAPVLRNAIAENPQLAQVAHDDIPVLQQIENTVMELPKGLGGTFNELAKGVNTVAGALPVLADAVMGGTRLQDAYFRNMVQPLEERADAFRVDPNANFLGKALNVAGSAVGTIAQAILTGGEAGAPALTPMAQTIRGLVEHGIKAMAVPATSAAVNTASDVYGQTGSGGAAAQAAAGAYATNTLGGIIPFGTAGRLSTRLASGAASGLVTGEVSRQLMNAALPDEMQQPEPTAEDRLLDALSGSVFGALAGRADATDLARRSYDAARQTYVEAARAQEAAQAAATISKLSELSAQSKLRERDPDSFKQLVQDAAEEAQVDKLYVGGRQFADALDKSGVSADELIEKVPALASQMREALQSEGAVQIPLQDYAAHIAGTPLDQALMPELRVAPDAMTFAESQAFYQDLGKRAEEQAKQALGDKASEEAFAQSGQQVEDYVRGQLDQANRFPPKVNEAYAKLWRAFFDTTAARTGMLPHELLEQHGIQVRADALPGSADYDQSAYHGSPYRGIDKFSTDKIGTGEGAQAYGWGLYFASKKDVAEYYRQALAPLRDNTEAEIEKTFGADRHFTAEERTEIYKAATSDAPIELAVKRLGYRKASLRDVDKAKLTQVIQSVRENAKGQLYEVDIPEDERMLHWEKPLSEQPEGVRKALEGMAQKHVEPSVKIHWTVDGKEIDTSDPNFSLAQKIASYGYDKVLADAEKRAADRASRPEADPLRRAANAVLERVRAMEGKKVEQVTTHLEPTDTDTTGKALYEGLTRSLGSDKAASEHLATLGIKGIKYLDRTGRADGEGSHNYVIFHGDDVQIKNQFYQSAHTPLAEGQTHVEVDGVQRQEARGQIAFGDGQAAISLFQHADLSTFLHESGHFFLETMSDLAQRMGPDSDIGRDFQKALDWAGANTDAEGWRQMTADQKRDAHEKFARGFEAYLLEGKAPTVELQSIFGRFRSWLVHIYQTVANLKAELSPEIRGVMDRMLASQEAIDQAQRTRGMIPMDRPEGMSDDAWAAYQRDQQAATEAAIADLQSKSIRDMRWISNKRDQAIKGLQKVAKETRETVRAQIEREVNSLPAFQAQDFMRENKGVDRELVAERFGYTSADQMAQDIADRGSKADVIEGLTDQRMLEEHGELTDQRAIERAAEAAIHNDVRARVLARELNALARATGSARALARAAREAADAAIGAKRAGDLNPRQYTAAESRAAKAADAAMRKGDTQEAVIQKRAQVLSNALAKSALDAQTEVQKGLDYLKRFTKDSIRSKVDVDIRDQIDALLEKVDLRKNPPDTPPREVRNLRDWADSQVAAGLVPAIPERLMDPAFRQHYADMTVEQFRGLVDAVKSMEHIGRERNTIMLAGERAVLDDVVREQLMPKLEEVGERFSFEERYTRPEDRDLNALQLTLARLSIWARSAHAMLLRPDFKANVLDRHQIDGPFQRIVFDPLMQASYRKAEMLKALSDKFAQVAERLGKDWQKSLTDNITNKTLIEPIASEEAGEPVYMKINRGRLLMIALHSGNESNFDKLTKGYGWRPEDVWRFLAENMTAKDIEAVNAVHELYDSHWPQMEAMYRRLGQTAPPKIEARPVDLPAGRMNGGYAHIDYDPLKSRRGEKAGQNEAKEIADKGVSVKDYFRRQGTTNGAMNARVQGYTDMIDLDFHGVERALQETIHDLAYREALVDVNKVLEHPELKRAYLKAYGRESLDALHTWMGRIANSNNADTDVKALTKVLSYARTGMVMNAIALRASTVVKHGGAAAFKSMGYFAGGGEKYYTSRQAAMTYDYKAQMAEAIERSPEIRQRLLQQDRDYRAASAHLFEAEGWQPKAERFGHAFVAFADAFSAVATHNAAYDWAINGIPERLGGTGQPMEHDAAVRFADKMVREAHGSTAEAAMSNIMASKNEATKLFTSLYGFMNNAYGQQADFVSKLRTAGIGKPEILARSFAAIIVPALAAGWVHGKTDDEGWAAWVAKSIAEECAATVPLVRDAAAMIQGMPNSGQVPVESWLHAVIAPIQDAVKEWHGQHAPLIQDIANAVGEGLHIPGLGQLGHVAQYEADVAAGRKEQSLKKAVVGGQ